MALAATTRIVANRKNLSTTLHFTANDTVTIAGNTTTSEIAMGDEVVTGGSITQVWFGSPGSTSGYWTIKRGANTVAVLDSTGYIDFAGCGNSLGLDQSANLTVELTGGVGYLVVEITKSGEFTSDYFQV